MADTSRFTEGIEIDGVITAALPVGALVLDTVTLELYRSTNAVVPTFTQVSNVAAGVLSDGLSLTYGTGLDVVHTADAASSNEQISQGAGTGDIQYMDAISVLYGSGEDVDFSPNGTDLLIQQGAGAGAVRVQDSLVWSWGTGNDVIWTPDGTNLVQTGAGEVRGNGLSNVIADPGDAVAIPVLQSGSVALTIGAGAETNTLAAPAYVGQMLQITSSVQGAGTRAITSAVAINQANNTIMTFAAVSDTIILVGLDIGGVLNWSVFMNDGAALS